MAFLNQFKSLPRGEEYGKDGACRAKALVRVQKLVEAFLTRQKIPTADGFAHELGVSRSTIERLLASREFQEALGRALDAHLSCHVKKAIDTVLDAMRPQNSGATRFRAATWLIERLDRLAGAMGTGADAEDSIEEQLRAVVEERLARLAAKKAAQEGTKAEPPVIGTSTSDGPVRPSDGFDDQGPPSASSGPETGRDEPTQCPPPTLNNGLSDSEQAEE